MAQFDYISELKSPQLKTRDGRTLPSPPEVEAYLSVVEQMRQDYLSYISDKDDRVLRACLGELTEVETVIVKRGFATMDNDNIVAAITGGIEGAETLLVLKNVDSALLASVKRSIVFIKSMLGEEEKTIAAPEAVEREEVKDDILRGVKGLADFLHIGKTKAQAIINSGILTKTKPPIQYSAGGWLFNKQRLQDYWDNHPTFVDDVKCPH